MTAMNRKYMRNKLISQLACIHDSNKIPTVISVFSGSGNTTGLVWIQIQMIRQIMYYTVHGQFIVLAYKFTRPSLNRIRCIGGMLSISQYPSHAPSVACMMPDPENMGIAVGISLVSRVQTEIYVISYVLPVYGRRLWFPTHPDVRQYCMVQSCCLTGWPRKHKYSGWNFVAITHMLRYALFCMQFPFMAAIFDISFTHTSESFKICCTVLLDIRDVKIALKIVSLSCTPS